MHDCLGVERYLPSHRVGQYQIERELGATRTAVVYEVAHLVLPRRAVLKVVHPRNQPLGVQLLREACIVEAIQHPGVPVVHESGVLEDRRPWFVLEQIDGTNLAERMARGPLDPTEAGAIVRDLAEILAHAHRRGILHLGLRPDRIVLTPKRQFPLCISDWSDARTHDAPAVVAIAGTSPYHAPELRRGDAIDDRADVFALGVIGYMALTGVRPFPTGCTVHVPTLERCPSAPRELAGLIDQMLAYDRFDRPSAVEIHTDLAELVTDVIDVVELPAAAAPVRIRRPKWTPAIPIFTTELDLDDLLPVGVDEGCS
ncbi:MAG: serine/threonine protein kinase [Deltaproteobacteria bacterium]|nr:serine/threonine protein kinase [Deltaproteobacteria bacterium]